jgi:hypothetical protein
MLGMTSSITENEFVEKINPYLDSNRVYGIVQLFLPSKEYPELRIDVNIRRKSVFARMANLKLQAHVNRYLTFL